MVLSNLLEPSLTSLERSSSFKCMKSQADHTMFYKHSSERRVIILIVYVHDIILIRDDVLKLDRLKKALAREFEIKDLAPLKYFLGIMEFTRSDKGIFISQRNYILDMLGVTSLLDCKAAQTPI